MASIALSCTYLISHIISVAIAAQSIVLQAVSWGNPAPQESTIDGAERAEGPAQSTHMSGDLATPLRSGSASGGAGCDVELAALNAVLSGSRRSQIHIIAQPCKERLLGLLLAIALIVPTATVVTVVAAEWVSSPSQRGWLILGFGFYIMTAMRSLWGYFIQAYEGMFHLKVELRRLVCPTLFDAVTDGIAQKAEEQGQTCSRAQETVQAHDALTGDFQVQFRFWSSRPRTVHLQLAADRSGIRENQIGEQRQNAPVTVQVQYQPGEDIVTGRDSRVERREIMVLTVKTSASKVLADKEVLRQWLENCYNKWVQPDAAIVNVFALQETSTDWVPEWKLERAKPYKTASGTGQAFYLERDCLNTVIADAQLWSGTALRVYLVIGPPGVGKSEFTIWLAGQMQLPVYRLCLSNPRLTDDRLAQLLSQSAITYNSVLMQVDEFQETVMRWVRAAESEEGASDTSGVTAGGFCECLQGSTAMGRGIIVLTGTDEIKAEKVWRLLPAVFRRVNFKVELGFMSKADVRSYLRHFLAPFLPGCTDEEWDALKETFTNKKSPWDGAQGISVDMLKQFLMHEITEARSGGLGNFQPNHRTAPGDFHIHPQLRQGLFEQICNAEKAHRFVEKYAKVGQ